jgi:hypothetical protein
MNKSQLCATCVNVFSRIYCAGIVVHGSRLLLLHDSYRQDIRTGMCADNGADIR